MTITASSLLMQVVMEKVHSNHAGGQSSKERIMAQDALTQLFKARVGAIYSDAYQFELMIFIIVYMIIIKASFCRIIFQVTQQIAKVDNTVPFTIIFNFPLQQNSMDVVNISITRYYIDI